MLKLITNWFDQDCGIIDPKEVFAYIESKNISPEFNPTFA
jgi:hypothetical protein